MTTHEILKSIGEFSNFEIELFEKCTSREIVNKNNLLLREGEICKSFYFILSGSFFQFQINEIEEVIVDLHLQNECMFNSTRLPEQTILVDYFFIFIMNNYCIRYVR